MKFAGLWNVLAIRFSSLLDPAPGDSSPLADRRTRRQRRGGGQSPLSLSVFFPRFPLSRSDFLSVILRMASIVIETMAIFFSRIPPLSRW